MPCYLFPVKFLVREKMRAENGKYDNSVGTKGKRKKRESTEKNAIHDSVLSLSLFHRPRSVLDFSLKSLDRREV